MIIILFFPLGTAWLIRGGAEAIFVSAPPLAGADRVGERPTPTPNTPPATDERTTDERLTNERLTNDREQVKKQTKKTKKKKQKKSSLCVIETTRLDSLKRLSQGSYYITRRTQYARPPAKSSGCDTGEDASTIRLN